MLGWFKRHVTVGFTTPKSETKRIVSINKSATTLTCYLLFVQSFVQEQKLRWSFIPVPFVPVHYVYKVSCRMNIRGSV